MINRLIQIVLAVCAFALLAAGCGGGDDETAGATASLTKSQFIKKANGICKAGDGKIERAFKRFAMEHNLSEQQPPNQKQLEEAATTILIPSIEGQIEDIRALGAPSGDEEQVDDFLTAVEAALEEAKKDPAAFIANQGEGDLAKAERKAQAYGLRACGGN